MYPEYVKNRVIVDEVSAGESDEGDIDGSDDPDYEPYGHSHSHGHGHGHGHGSDDDEEGAVKRKRGRQKKKNYVRGNSDK